MENKYVSNKIAFSTNIQYSKKYFLQKC